MTQITPTTADIAAALSAFEEAGYALMEANVAATADTVDSFREIWGTPTDIDADTGVAVWENIQVRKGARRGDLVVFPIDGGSISYFGGES